MSPTSLTPKQLHTLRHVDQHRVTGELEGNSWIFRVDGIACTAAVMALSAKALITITRGRWLAQITLSERGRAALAKEQVPCR